MNIFFLDEDPTLSAQYHVDKHVVKMILETAQLLCGAHHVTPQVPTKYPPSTDQVTTKYRTSYHTKTTPVQYGLESRYLTIFICVIWVLSCVRNIHTDMVRDISPKTLLSGV